MCDEFFMEAALREAEKAAQKGEVPIGAVIVFDNKIIARAHNQVETLNDPTAHAEMLAITQATTAINDWRLNECELYVTKEPCPMCAGASVLARLKAVVFGCFDPKYGAAGSALDLLQFPTWNHRCQVRGGVLEEKCATLLRTFFQQRRIFNSTNHNFSKEQSPKFIQW
ncbi:MAG: tRNA adenosine(34) deaminase TadA [Chthoniobacterales bacterium]|nr:tRNA adenosine(34) deaminase TadA [Chthoniobacterales bacterium]